jgi:thiamine biosynthesis lipoprotein
MVDRSDAAHAAIAAQMWLGTLVEISVRADTEAVRKDALAAAFAAIARVHRALSRHDPESELSRVNRCAVQATQAISKDFRLVLERALEIARQSAGAFDPTVGRERTLQNGATWRDVELDARGVRFARPLALDFDGIAKGYAVDCAVAALQAHGVTAGRVNAGGDLRVFGADPEPIHVRTGGPQSVVVPLASLADGAVATSAYGGQRRRRSGRWTTPLIDPRSTLPRMSTRTVSVIAADCITADALTKVVALDGGAAAKLLASCGAAAAILSPARGRWRCTRLPRAEAIAA